jgi:transcriptional regulator with PAS, ATPase and Fis domain
MRFSDWWNGIKAAVTVCDNDGIILDMNEAAAGAFSGDGGRQLVGKSLMECHPEKAREKLRTLLETESVNAYTIEKNGIKKLIYQLPWYKNGKFAGLVEFSLPIPFEMPHFIRANEDSLG